MEHKVYNIANKYFLPRGYLSYSCMNDFYYNRSRFQQKYYEGKESPATPELAFGKRIGELLEHDDSSMKHVLRYDTAEQKLDFKVDGIPVIGYMDTFDSVLHKIGEYKTGKTPWTQGRVDKHFQLDVYSLGVETIFGSVDDECVLVWLETERVERTGGGRVSHETAYGIQFTGKVREFRRVITKEDRVVAYDRIITTAQDISEDYTDWLSSQKKTLGGRQLK